MKFNEIRLEMFRNIPAGVLTFEDTRTFLIGQNGQGKTNLLEALNFVTAVRSFRTNDIRSLIAWESPTKEARTRFLIEHETQGELELLISIGKKGKRIEMDGEPITRLGDFMGVFPTVCCSSEDIQMVRSGPASRRRFIDMLMVVSDPEYYSLLLEYHRALKRRNACLKQSAGRSVRYVYDQRLMATGLQLVEKRSAFLASFQKMFEVHYSTLSGVDEQPEISYDTTLKELSSEVYRQQFESHAARDEKLGNTSFGPHRDDMLIRLKGHPASVYASEGQQRGLVLALRLAEIGWIREHTGIQPVVLADDILGELDESRQAGFWKTIGEDDQVVATGTVFPRTQDPGDWKVHRIENGKIFPE